MSEDRADLRTGIATAVLANVHRGKNSKVFKPSDFMPQFGVEEKPKRRQSVASMKAALTSATLAFLGANPNANRGKTTSPANGKH